MSSGRFWQGVAEALHLLGRKGYWQHGFVLLTISCRLVTKGHKIGLVAQDCWASRYILGNSLRSVEIACDGIGVSVGW